MTDLESSQNRSVQRLRYNPRSKPICAQCRYDKQACTPPDRNWVDYRQRCDRCVKLELDCSEPQRLPTAAFRTSSFTKPVDSRIIVFQADLCTPPTDTSMVSPINNIDNRHITDRDMTSQLDSPADHGHKSLDSSCVPKPSREETQQEAQALIKNLGDSKAILTNLNCEIRTAHEIRSLLGEADRNKRVLEMLEKAIRVAALQVRDMLNGSAGLRSRVTGVYKRLFSSQLSTLANDIWTQASSETNFKKDSTTVINELIQPDPQIWKESYDSIKATPHSIAEFLSTFVGRNMPTIAPSVIFSMEEAATKYQQAADHLQQCIENINVETASYRLSSAPNSSPPHQLKAYSALHLAYRTGSYRVAHKMCEKLESLFETDMLERTILHYAVDNNDIKTVRVLIGLDKDIVQNTGGDIFGLTPVALAAMRGNAEIFEALIREDACDQPRSSALLWSGHRSALGIALQCGSKDVVTLMLERKLSHPFASNASDLMSAIVGQQEDLARFFLRVLKQQTELNEEQLKRAGAAAKDRHLHGLVEDIYKELRQSNSATPLAACSYLDKHNFEQFIAVTNHNLMDSQLSDTYMQFPTFDRSTDATTAREAQERTLHTHDDFGWETDASMSNHPFSNHSNFQNVYPLPNLSSEAQSLEGWHSSNGIPLTKNIEGSELDSTSSTHYPSIHPQTYARYNSFQADPEIQSSSPSQSEWRIPNSRSGPGTGLAFNYQT